MNNDDTTKRRMLRRKESPSMMTATEVAENNERTRGESDRFLKINVDCSYDTFTTPTDGVQQELCPFSKRYGSCDLAKEYFDESSPALSETKSDGDSFSSASLREILIPFDYEIYYTEMQEPPVDFLQGFLLYYIAQVWNLPDCSLLLRGRRREEIVGDANGARTSSTGADDSLILAVSSDFSDVADSEAVCEAPVESSIKESSSCRRVSGEVKVYVKEETLLSSTSVEGELLSITSQVLKGIRSIMSDDKMIIATPTGSIRRVIFMGQREVVMVDPPEDNIMNHSPTTTLNQVLAPQQPVPGISSVTIAFMSIIFFLLLVLFGILCLFRSQRRKRGPFTVVKVQDGCDVDNQDDAFSEGIGGDDDGDDYPTPIPFPHEEKKFSGGKKNDSGELLDTTLDITFDTTFEATSDSSTARHEDGLYDHSHSYKEVDEHVMTVVHSNATKHPKNENSGTRLDMDGCPKTTSRSIPTILEIKASQDSNDISTMHDSHEGRCLFIPHDQEDCDHVNHPWDHHDHDPPTTPTRKLNYLSEPGHITSFGDDEEEEEDNSNDDDDLNNFLNVLSHDEEESSKDTGIVDTSFAAACSLRTSEMDKRLLLHEKEASNEEEDDSIEDECRIPENVVMVPIDASMDEEFQSK